MEIFSIWLQAKPESSERIELDFLVQHLRTFAKYFFVAGIEHFSRNRRIQVRTQAPPYSLLLDISDEYNPNIYSETTYFIHGDILFKLDRVGLFFMDIPTIFKTKNWNQIELGFNPHPYSGPSFAFPYIYFDGMIVNLDSKKRCLEKQISGNHRLSQNSKHFLLASTHAPYQTLFIDKSETSQQTLVNVDVTCRDKTSRISTYYRLSPILALNIWIYLGKTITIWSAETGNQICEIPNPIINSSDHTVCGSRIIVFSSANTAISTEYMYVYQWSSNQTLNLLQRLSLKSFKGLISSYRMPNGFGLVLSLGSTT